MKIPPAHTTTMSRRAIAMTLIAMLATAFMTVLASPSSADVPDLEFVSVTGVSNSDNKGLSVTCPGNKRVVGVGADLDGARGKVVLDEVVPSLNSVSAHAYEYGSRYNNDNSGTQDDWRIRVWAYCANPHGAVVTSSRESVNSSNNKSVTVNCPSGYDVIGSGAELTGALGEVVIDEIIPTATSVTVRGLEDDTGLAADWKIRAYAICAQDRPAGLEIISRDSSTGSDDTGTYAHCPGKRALSGGFDIAGGAGETGIEDLIPGTDTFVAFAAEEWDGSDGNGRDWFVRTYVICATQ
ncbi:hypothetical protein [Nonomuraea basaltis]|uniref:hypothetical protein n=1 Tax=Nonomuraea basaltis TaxID=2495887 RepID=UPI00110C5DA1|nr:hypothetical protein [Nonomuraea basaltis]TMR91443.1 hypothetical protein EJK15_49960 [Nonomuraea basaltis]